MICVLCKEEIENDRLAMRQVTGFEKLRARGGANMIHDRRETGQWAHDKCVKRSADVGMRQNTML